MNRNLSTLSAMALFLISALAPVSAGADQAVPTDAARKAQMQCMWEAKWPLRHSSAYRSADVRTKRQLANSSNPEVRKMQGVCRALSSTLDTEKRQARANCQELLLVKRMRGGDDARLPANRIEQVCTALSDPPVNLMTEGNTQ